METDANPIDPTTPRLESEPAAPKQAPLGAAAASGAAWGILATMVTKIGGFIANIFLARLLLPESFGEFAKAGIVIAFAVMPRDQALPQVLMHRQDQLKQSENSAFWLSIVLGLLSGVLMGGAGLYLYLRYGTSVVVWLLILASIASPLQAIGVVPWVALQAQFRFRFIARIGMLTVLGTSLASVILAWARWGAYSLLVPALLFSVLRSAALLGAGRTKVEPRLGIDQWWTMAAVKRYRLIVFLQSRELKTCVYGKIISG
jgi:PST family polysaccharide transporter